MPFTWRRWDDVCLVSFRGELDDVHLPDISARLDALVEAGAVRLVFDLHDLVFLGSAALGLFIRTKKRVTPLRGDLVLSRPSRLVWKALRTLGLEELIAIEASEAKAIRRLPGEPLAVDVTTLPPRPDGDLAAENAVLFRSLDATRDDVLIGNLVDRSDDRLAFCWRLPRPGGGPGERPAVFGYRIWPGTTLALRVRGRRGFDSAEGQITEVTWDGEGRDVTVHLELMPTGVVPAGIPPLGWPPA